MEIDDVLLGLGSFINNVLSFSLVTDVIIYPTQVKEIMDALVPHGTHSHSSEAW